MVPFTIRTRIETDITGQLDRRWLFTFPCFVTMGAPRSLPPPVVDDASGTRWQGGPDRAARGGPQRPDAHHGRTRGTLARGAKDKDDCLERIDDLSGPSARPGPGGFDNRHARTPATAGLTWLLPFADSGKRA